VVLPARPARKRRLRHSLPVTAAALAGAVLSVLPAHGALADPPQKDGGRGAFTTSFEPADPASTPTPAPGCPAP
jgi:hypothetical protein